MTANVQPGSLAIQTMNVYVEMGNLVQLCVTIKDTFQQFSTATV
jgi:hypothetical protein